MSITVLLAEHHKYCDELFAGAEEGVARQDWAAAGPALRRLLSALETHFRAEEDILFPAFEQASGLRSGPTEVMRGEHRQIRELLQMLQQALADKDSEAFAGAAETLLILMQQHNLKEENILYPLCERTLATEAAVYIAVRSCLES
ncbi:MAG: hemerythrin domain-containing protein [Rhodocyclales bacterium]|nr:hemerythrin domain-containing protein [Rhodocyclales bacterium]